jgi:hypothetical protein
MRREAAIVVATISLFLFVLAPYLARTPWVVR